MSHYIVTELGVRHPDPCFIYEEIEIQKANSLSEGHADNKQVEFALLHLPHEAPEAAINPGGSVNAVGAG